MIVYPQGGSGRRPGWLQKKRIYASDAENDPGQVRIIPFYGTDGSKWWLILTDELPTTVEAPVVAGSPTAVNEEDSAWKAFNVDTGESVALVLAVDSLLGSDDSAATSPPTFNPDILYYDFSETGRDIRMHEIQYAQAGDVMIAVHGKMRPLKFFYDPAAKLFGAKFYCTSFPRTFGNARVDSPPPPSVYKSYAYEGIGEQLSEGSFTVDVDLDILDDPDGVNSNCLLDFTFFDTTYLMDDRWVGRVLKCNQDGKTIIVQITRYPGLNQAYARVLGGLMDAEPTLFTSAQVERGSWDDIHGWPRTVAFFDTHLILGGTEYFPDKAWVSQVNDIEEFMVRKLEQDPAFADPVAATDPFATTLKQNIFSAIRWMSPDKTIPIGTSAGEFILQGPDQTLALGPTNTSNNVETPHGSAYAQAVRNDNTNIFIQRNRKYLREMVFNLDENSFIAPNLSILAEHIVNKFGLERMENDHHEAVLPGAMLGIVRQGLPYGIIWAFDNNGCLLGLTRDREQNIAAWHAHEIAGDVTEDDLVYKPFVSSLGSIQKSAEDDDGTGGEPDELWGIIRRRLGGNIFYLEKMLPDWEFGKIHQNWDFDLDRAPVYMDGAVFKSNSQGSSSLGGIVAGVITLDHLLAGQEVSVIMNGHDLGEYTVDSDLEIDISARLTAAQLGDSSSVDCIVGFNFLGRLNPLPPEVPATLGTSMGNLRRIDRMTINFYRSLGVRFGRYEDLVEENTPVDEPDVVEFPDPADLTIPKQLFTGEKTVNFPQGYEGRPRVLIESYRPLPCMISHITTRMSVNE